MLGLKGIILAGGTGSRLMPMTKVTNKHLLPVYDKPMIMYPLEMLVGLGLSDIMIVSGKGHAGHFLELLGSGSEYHVRLSYAVQEKPGGIAEALGLTEDFADNDTVAVILGDNIYQNPLDIKNFNQGARIYLKRVPDPQRFGVAYLSSGKISSIIEKPQDQESDLAVTGFYLYDNSVYEKVKRLKPSKRQELEITDVNNSYIQEGTMDHRFVDGFWTDAGNIESLYTAATLVREAKLNNIK